MLWGVGTQNVSFASEFGSDAARETLMTLEDRVAALTAELAQVKAETAKLRESQSDTSEDLSHIRASIANAEIGLSALRTTTDGNEARQRDAAAQIASGLAQLKDETLHLRMAQDDTATEIGSLRAGVANSEIGIDGLRATTGEIGGQVRRIEAAREATGSIARSHRHPGQKKWVAQR
jgi:septal ring factor EnvC (AmiA/AmiB activator)